MAIIKDSKKQPEVRLWLPDGQPWIPAGMTKQKKCGSGQLDVQLWLPNGQPWLHERRSGHTKDVDMSSTNPVCLTEGMSSLSKSRPNLPVSGREISGNLSISPPLPGFIGYAVKPSGVYAKYVKNTFVINGSVYHDSEYLGKVLNKELGVFQNRSRGIFSFSLEHGYGIPSAEYYASELNLPDKIVLNFGDIWMVDQIMNEIGFHNVIENLIPSKSDTLKALICYRLLSPYAYQYATNWFQKSYARILYPLANLASPRISELLSELGTLEIHKQFFQSYLSVVIKGDTFIGQLSFPVIVDSIGVQNDINIFLTALSNHGGISSKEIRITYVIDKNSKLPLFYWITAGNIIDNSLLIFIVNMLANYNIEVELIIMDAGYSSMSNISDLLSAKIPFVTRMPENRKEFKKLISEHGQNIKCGQNAILFGNRGLYAKKVPIEFEGHQLFAYLMHDIGKEGPDELNIIKKYADDDEKHLKIDAALLNAGKFVLLSSNDYPKDEILPLYNTRQSIEQVFDIKQNYAGGTPLRGHTEETVRGSILINFIVTVIYATLGNKLYGSKFSANSAIIKMKDYRITVYDHVKTLEIATKEQKEIFNHLHLNPPFVEESGNKIASRNSFITNLNSQKRGRGRPKGSKNIIKNCQPSDMPSNIEGLHSRNDLPKGSTNLQKTSISNDKILNEIDSIGNELRRRGRPKGSKNKPKANQPNNMITSVEGQRSRGRPKGSKNKIMVPPTDNLRYD
jgi:hypothetical protein